MAKTPSFIYFDLGNVIVNFDHHRGARQMAEVAGVSEEVVWRVVFESDLELEYERGAISTHEFYEAFCDQTDSRPDQSDLLHAAADIFELNEPIVPILQRLHRDGHRLGILSNTNEAHWDFIVSGRFPIVNELFELYALSFEMRLAKPDLAIYQQAARLAGVACGDIFFTDDRIENVEGAITAGCDATHFVRADQLRQQLRDRSLRL